MNRVAAKADGRVHRPLHPSDRENAEAFAFAGEHQPLVLATLGLRYPVHAGIDPFAHIVSSWRDRYLTWCLRRSQSSRVLTQAPGTASGAQSPVRTGSGPCRLVGCLRDDSPGGGLLNSHGCLFEIAWPRQLGKGRRVCSGRSCELVEAHTASSLVVGWAACS